MRSGGPPAACRSRRAVFGPRAGAPGRRPRRRSSRCPRRNPRHHLAGIEVELEAVEQHDVPAARLPGDPIAGIDRLEAIQADHGHQGRLSRPRPCRFATRRDEQLGQVPLVGGHDHEGRPLAPHDLGQRFDGPDAQLRLAPPRPPVRESKRVGPTIRPKSSPRPPAREIIGQTAKPAIRRPERSIVEERPLDSGHGSFLSSSRRIIGEDRRIRRRRPVPGMQSESSSPASTRSFNTPNADSHDTAKIFLEETDGGRRILREKTPAETAA